MPLGILSKLHMKGPWTRSKYTRDELDKQSVEFELKSKNVRVSGIGEFWVAQNPEKRLAIDIVIYEPGAHWSEIRQTQFHLQQVHVDRIEINPDQTKAKFRLLA